MKEKNNINKTSIFKVLVAPLDWGLGHTTRCIPVIYALLKNGADVILAAENEPKILLRKEFPNLQIIELEGYRVRYQKKGSFSLKLLSQVPSILSSIKRENIWLKQKVEEYNIDIVISDNRYGLYNSSVYNIIITHQLTFVTGYKFLNNLLQKLNYRFIEKFDECWIPDVEGAENISGVISHPLKMPETNVKFLGLLSRFKKLSTPIKNDFLFLISGPEPQRTVFEDQLIILAKNLRGKKVMVRGKPDDSELFEVNGIECFNHLNSEELNHLISESEIIICRSGYSTIMDLCATQKKALLIPTPGQKEQEYLANYLDTKNGFIYLKKFTEIDEAIEKLKAKDLPPLITCFVDDAVNSLFKKINSRK